MSAAILLQDWVTIRGNATTTTVTQQETDYVDLAAYQDVVVWFECSDAANGPRFEIQTSPTKDDSLFVVVDTSAAFAAAVGVTTKILRYSAVTCPLARFLRWKVVSSSFAGSVCSFRIWLSANLS